MPQQIAYEYARRNANLVLVARREQRLFGIRDNARLLGAGQVLVIAADVVKEDDCRRLVSDTVSYFGQREFNYQRACINAFPHSPCKTESHSIRAVSQAEYVYFFF